MTKPKHEPCRCGCGELADECPTGRNPLGAFTIAEPVGSRTGRCGWPMRPWATPLIGTPCGRPPGHKGDHWPVPMASDERERP